MYVRQGNILRHSASTFDFCVKQLMKSINLHEI